MLYLSLCMIVRNEEHVLRRCLDSVKGIVDEIVIADTGSTDNTIKIASEYTDHIYKFEWTDSFSDARNFVQKKAVGKWILVLDADEFVDRDNLIEIKGKLKEQVEPLDAFDATIYNFTGTNGDRIIQHNSIRIYINNPAIKYERTIHEQLVCENGKIKAHISNLVIYHSGYLNNIVKSKDKSSRNTRLIGKQTEMTGQTSFDYFNLGNELISVNKIEKALEAYQKAYLLNSDIKCNWGAFTVLQIIICLRELKRYKQALSVIDDAESLWDNAPEFKCLKGQVFLSQNRYEDSKEQLISLIEDKNKYKTFIKSIDFLELFPYMALGCIYEKEGNISMAITSYAHILSDNKKSFDATYKLLSILTKNCTQEEILNFIEIQKLCDEDNRINIIKILLDLLQCELAEIYINQLDSSHIIKVGMLLKINMLKNEYSVAINILNNVSDADLNRILNEGFFDCIDLFLLYLLTKDLLVFSRIERIIGDKGILAFLKNSNITSEADKNLFIILADRSIKFKWFELFDNLLPKDKYKDSSVDLAIGHILCNNGFSEIALSFYEKVGDIKLLDEPAFVNIIEAVIKLNDKENALQYALRGIELAYTDFRLFKFAIELLREQNEKDIKEEIIKLASKHYPDSNWLKAMTN